MNLRLLYQSGANAALEKLAVSGAMYARALANQAAQIGRALPRAQMAPMRAAPRASFEPDLSAMARSRGARMPSPEQLAMRKFTGMLQTRSNTDPLSEQQTLKNRALFGLAGHQYSAAPDLEAQIGQLPRRPKGDTTVNPMAATQAAAPKAIPKPSRPETMMGRWPSPVRTGAGRSRSFEAIEPTKSNPHGLGHWGEQDATMPEHFSSIPGMPAYRPY